MTEVAPNGQSILAVEYPAPNLFEHLTVAEREEVVRVIVWLVSLATRSGSPMDSEIQSIVGKKGTVWDDTGILCRQDRARAWSTALKSYSWMDPSVVFGGRNSPRINQN